MSEVETTEATQIGGGMQLLAYYWEYDPRDPRYTGMFRIE